MKTSGDTVPFIEKSQLDQIWNSAGAGTAGVTQDTLTLDIKKATTADEWEITLTGRMMLSGDISLCAKYMPVVNTSISGSGVSLASDNNVPATVIRDGNGKEWYTQTFTYEKTGDARLNVGTVQVNGKDAQDYKTNVVETADGYRVTVMVARNGRGTNGNTSVRNNAIGTITVSSGTVALTDAVAGQRPVSITLPVTGVTGHRVELVEDSRFTIVSDGGRNFQYVRSGTAANFTIKLNGNYSVERGEGYEVSTHSGTSGIIVTVPNVTADKKITLNIRDISNQGNVYYEATAKGNLVNADNNAILFGASDGGTGGVTGTPASVKKGDLINGEGDWRIKAELGYVPMIKATYANGTRDVTEECVGIRYIRTEGTGKARKTVWEITVTATESVHLDFDLTPAITSTENSVFGFGQAKGGPARGLDLQIYSGITVNTVATSGVEKNRDVDYMGVDLLNVTPVTTIYDADKKTIPFYVLVHEDCEIVAGIVGDGTISVDMSDSDRYMLSVPDGYRAVLVTVNLPVGHTGTYTGVVELRAVYNNK